MTNRPQGLAELDRIEVVFAALAHPTRRQILTVLRARGGTMTSGELASRFECSWPTTTRHLGVLADADLVTTVKHGRERHYSLNIAELDNVAGTWIDRFRASSADDVGVGFVDRGVDRSQVFGHGIPVPPAGEPERVLR